MTIAVDEDEGQERDKSMYTRGWLFVSLSHLYVVCLFHEQKQQQNMNNS